MGNCRDYWFQPLYGEAKLEGVPDHIHAPNLHYAFRVARRKWPDAEGWKCLGLVSRKDPEVCRKSKDTGKQVLVTGIHKP